MSSQTNKQNQRRAQGLFQAEETKQTRQLKPKCDPALDYILWEVVLGKLLGQGDESGIWKVGKRNIYTLIF